MELTLEELDSPKAHLPDSFEAFIPDDSMVINVKYNFDIPDEEGGLEFALSEICFSDMRRYVQDLEVEILFSSVGYHLLGERKQPHVHYHFITSPFHPPSNPSQHRKRWAKKENAAIDFLKCSFKFQSLDGSQPKYQVLSYPLKEGHLIKHNSKLLYVFNKKPMTSEQMIFLKDVGKAIYDKEQGLKLRQDKCEERKKVALHFLYEICEANKDKFNTYREMVIWLEENYIAQLTLDEKPDINHYRTNCQKIANTLGKLKYCDIL